MTKKKLLRLIVSVIIIFTPVLLLAQEANEFKHFEKEMEMFWVIGATFMLILGLFAVIIMFFIIHSRKERRRHELIGHFIEKGQEVPRELLLGRMVGAALSPEQWAGFIRSRDFRRGTWLLCLGLAIGVALYFLFRDMSMAIGFLVFFLFLSAGCFINALFFSGKSDFNRKKERDD